MRATGEPNPREVLPSTSRYELIVKIASGGMATVYVARSRAPGGITRLFAVKRAHGHLLDDVVFRRMFAEEARLASGIHHPNVIAVQDVEELDDELLLIMDYVEGVALADFRARASESSRGELDPRTRTRLATRVVLDACAGLHAAHELCDTDGRPLDIVHRDVSPHNVLVGIDGIARVTDFGIAKSAARTTSGKTATGGLKGKLSYMAPEYVETQIADRRADLFGLGAVLYEALTGDRLFHALSELETMKLVLRCEVPTPISGHHAIDAVVLRALAKSPDERFSTAREFGDALEQAARDADLLATHAEVGELVAAVAHDVLALRRQTIQRAMRPDADTADDGDEPTNEDFAGYQGHDRTQTIEPMVNKPALPLSLPLAHEDQTLTLQQQDASKIIVSPAATMRVVQPYVDPTMPAVVMPVIPTTTPSQPPPSSMAMPMTAASSSMEIRRPASSSRSSVFVMVLAAAAVVVAWFGGSHLAKRLASPTQTAPETPTALTPSAVTTTTIAPTATDSSTSITATPTPTPPPTPTPTPAIASSIAVDPRPTHPTTTTTTTTTAPRPKPPPTRPPTPTANTGDGPMHAPPSPYKRDSGR